MERERERESWFRQWWLQTIGVPILVLVVVSALIIAGYKLGTGFAGKTLWDWLNLLGIVAVPAVVGAAAIGFSKQQGKISTKDADRARKLNREGIQAQTFAHIVEYERTIGFSEKMDTIQKLSDELSYDQHETDILDVVNFLDYVAHLIRHRYVIPQHVLLLYERAINTCRQKLIDQDPEAIGWLKTTGWASYQQSSKGRYYLHFRRLCNPDTLEKLWRRKDKEIDWPIGGNPETNMLEELE